MTNYQLYVKSGVPKSTIGNLVNSTYDSVKLRVIHEVCQGFGISITEFFHSPLGKGRELLFCTKSEYLLDRLCVKLYNKSYNTFPLLESVS